MSEYQRPVTSSCDVTRIDSRWPFQSSTAPTESRQRFGPAHAQTLIAARRVCCIKPWSARLQARACLALANWRVDRNRNARAALLAIKPALTAGGRVAAYWLAKVGAAIAESAG